tara:strand:- start:192 stop:1187 length:996 start_codon:yes stop_codon:yes gene_type:complete
MKKYELHLGIDVSKATLDICVMDNNAIVLDQLQIKNSIKEIKKFVKNILSKELITLFCFENTGVYSMLLAVTLNEMEQDYWEVPAIEIKRSKGISRGKTDKADAKDISLYSIRSKDKLKLSSVTAIHIQQLRLLFSEREKVIKAIKLFESTTENEDFLPNSIFKEVKQINKRTQQKLAKTLIEINSKMNMLIQEHKELKKQKELLKSIPGIGDVTALYMMLITQGFKAFDNWRQFACYSGIAPFEYSSGSSIKGRTKVNHMADKKMKSLLHMASLSAMKVDPEMKRYYERKKEEGKSSMLVLNNIRCKLAGRAFAVINRGTPFVNMQKFAA